MSRGKRPPIDYKMQLFRPKQVIAEELQPPEEHPDERPEERTSGGTNSRTSGRTSGRTSVRRKDHKVGITVEQPGERTKVRHSFDIYRDQLVALTQIQAAVYRQGGRKPTIGELVQQAIDEFLHSFADIVFEERSHGRQPRP